MERRLLPLIIIPFARQYLGTLNFTQQGGVMETAHGHVIGLSQVMNKVQYLAEAVASYPCTVLITGESGTGKEVLARMIHARSDRSKQPFMAVNCGSIPATLLESQLFGHRKGAFTGAVADVRGYFQAAGNGTLFLDEIAEIDPPLQVKLLRALQERSVTPVGDTAPIPVGARIIAATNCNLLRAIREGRFREDLFYRLNVINISLPPLRQRLEDIPDLVCYFVDKVARRYGVQPRKLEPGLIEVLQGYHWPGNVRELENAIEYAYAIGANGTITVDSLPDQVRQRRAPPDHVPANGVPTYSSMERQAITQAMQVSGGNKSRAARLLGINRQRLYRRLNKYGIA